MKRISPFLLLFLLGCTLIEPSSPTEPAGPASSSSTTLVFDGFFGDWPDEPVYTDPAGDGGPSGVDITDISVAHTDSHLVIYVDVGEVVNLQSERALALSFFAGNGPEVEYDFGARRGRADGLRIGHADIGLVTLPTVTSDRFEIVIQKDAVVNGDILFPGNAPVTLTFYVPGNRGDVVSPVIYNWDNPAGPSEALNIEQADGTLRVVSYNIEHDGVLDSQRAGYFRNILSALQPDVIAFQEVDSGSAAAVEARVEDWLGGDWYALKQSDLVTVSRYPFVRGWADTYRPLNNRVYVQMIEVDGNELLIFNAHFFCCDNNEGRQEQADGFAAFVRDSVPEDVPFILVGDLNLVGDAEQLSTLITGDIDDEGRYGRDSAPDWDGTTLADLVPRHLGSPHTFTWLNPGSDFAPGRLDYAIYTDSLLSASGYVFDPSELSASQLNGLGMAASDGYRASDHFPLVVDLFFLP